jgi:hypothetical protein
MKKKLKTLLKEEKFKYVLIIIDSCRSHELANDLKSKKWAVIASTNPVNYSKGTNPSNGYSAHVNFAHSSITYATKFTKRMISILLRMTKADVSLKLRAFANRFLLNHDAFSLRLLIFLIGWQTSQSACGSGMRIPQFGLIVELGDFSDAEESVFSGGCPCDNSCAWLGLIGSEKIFGEGLWDRSVSPVFISTRL